MSVCSLRPHFSPVPLFVLGLTLGTACATGAPPLDESQLAGLQPIVSIDASKQTQGATGIARWDAYQLDGVTAIGRDRDGGLLAAVSLRHVPEADNDDIFLLRAPMMPESEPVMLTSAELSQSLESRAEWRGSLATWQRFERDVALAPVGEKSCSTVFWSMVGTCGGAGGLALTCIRSSNPSGCLNGLDMSAQCIDQLLDFCDGACSQFCYPGGGGPGCGTVDPFFDPTPGLIPC